MAVTRQSLEENYQRLNDDELQRLLHSGELTALASEVAVAELQHRGVAVAADQPADEKEEADDEEAEDSLDAEPEVAAAASDGGGNLVLLARYTSPIEAEMARGRLAAEGILAVVADAQMVQMMGFMSHAFGGVRLLVRQAELDRARDILQSISGR